MKPKPGLFAVLLAYLCWRGATGAVAAPPPAMAFAWGYDSTGQTNIPLGLTNLAALAAGGFHNLALRVDGSIVAWGAGTTNSGTSPDYGQSIVPSAATNIISLAAGGYHSLALRANGTILGWGAGTSQTPIQPNYGQAIIPAAASSIVAISAGWYHSVALKTNGLVLAWGNNDYGQTKVPSGLSGVRAVAAGGFHNAALTTNGTVVAWGYGLDGETNVPPGLSNVIAIAAGRFHNLALRSDGTITAWGAGTTNAGAAPHFGQSIVPVDLTNVVAIAAGDYHSLALTANGTVIGWGNDTYGQTTSPAGITNATGVAAGSEFSALLTPMPIIWQKPPPSLSVTPAGYTNLTIAFGSGDSALCQWFFNQSPLTGATSTSLTLTNFGLAQAGHYSVSISNQYGYASTPSVVRLVNSPVILVDGVDAGGGTFDGGSTAIVSLTSDFGANANIFYTLDGSAPDFTQLPYSGPFSLSNSTTIRAIAYSSDFRKSAEAAAIDVEIRPLFTLIASTPGGGTINLSPVPDQVGNLYFSNTMVQLIATPSNGWRFIAWTGDVAASTNRTAILMNGPHQVQAIFGAPLDLFTNGNGIIRLDPLADAYAFGSNVLLTAVPGVGSYFFGWAGGTNGPINPLLLAIEGPTSLTANFGLLRTNQVSLTVIVEGGGTVAVSPQTNVYTKGETITLTASPAAHFAFAGWSGDATGAANPLAITLDTSKVISAVFVTGALTNPPVFVQQPRSRTVAPGSTATFDMQVGGDPPFSYQWSFDGTPIPGATGSFLLLTNAAASQAGVYSVVVTGPGGTTTSTPAGLALFGMQMTLSASGPAPLLTIDGPKGTSYLLEYSQDLASTNWVLLAPATVGNSGFSFVDGPVTNTAARFYRATPQ